MKKNDLLIIVAVAITAGIFSFAIANFFFGGAKKYTLTAPTVEPITAQFTAPSTKYFNQDSLDLTKDITVGDNANNQPFKPSANQ